MPPGTIERFLPPRSAVGLYVPGAGATVSRESAIASLRRGKVENSLLGGTPSGPPLVDVVAGIRARTVGKPAVYVTLPPPGRHPNTKRYPIAVVGGGYHGILTSTSTRIRGLVSVADVAPTLVALREGRAPPIRSEAEADARADVRALDTRLARVHEDRGWALTAVVLTAIALSLVAPRAAVAAGAAAVVSSLLLAALGATRFWVVLLAIVVLTVVLAAVATARRRLLPWTLAAFLVAFAVVLVWDTELNSLGVLGARPDGGGRFYGIGNQVETLLLAPVLAAAATAGRRGLVVIGTLAVIVLGWSRAGADGGGLLVYAAALVALGLRLYAAALTPRRVALAAAAVVAGALALVGLDAALGGSSHVTHAVGGGPATLLHDFTRRAHLSWASATDSGHRVFTVVACAAVLAVLASLRPRRPTVDAMLVGIVVSLFVNDTPGDVLGLGLLGCWTLFRWESVDSPAMRRAASIAAAASAVLVLGGCGGGKTVSPVAETVVGTLQQEAPGKAIFTKNGCNGCHTYKPAGASGNVGPDLDKLAQYAQQAKQPLEKFTRESIVDPNAYVEKGFPKGVMPSFKQLPQSDLSDLVQFLTKPQG